MQRSIVACGTYSPALRRAEGHHLADRDRDIGIPALRLIAPASFGILGVHDQVHGFGQFVAHVRAACHAVGFGQEQCGKTVAVHRAMPGILGHVNEAFVPGVVQDELDRPADFLAIGPLLGRTSRGDKRNPGQRRRPRYGSSRPSQRTIFLLPLGQICQAAIDAAQRGRRHQFHAAAVRRVVTIRRSRTRSPREDRHRHGRQHGLAVPGLHGSDPERFLVEGPRFARSAYGLRDGSSASERK